MTQSNGTAAGVDVIRSQVEDLIESLTSITHDRGQGGREGIKTYLGISLDHRGERLVELPHFDILHLDPRLLEHDGHDLCRRDGEVNGIHSRVRGRHDAREDLFPLAVLLRHLAVTQDQRRRAVVKAGAVGRGDGPGARAIERRFQRRDLLELELVVPLVLADGGVAFFTLDHDGDDLVLEQALGPRRLRALVAQDGEVVLLLARDAEFLDRVLRAVAHVHLVVDVPEAVGHQAVDEFLVAEGGLVGGAGQVVRDAGHVLHASRDGGLDVAQLDVLRGEGDGFHPRSADFIHGRGFDGGREARENGGLTRGGLAAVRLQDLAHVDVGDELGGNGGALEGGFDGVGAEDGGGDGGKAAIELGEGVRGCVLRLVFEVIDVPHRWASALR